MVKYAYALLSDARKPAGAAGLAWPADGVSRVRHSVLRLLLTALQMGAPGVADALADLAAVRPSRRLHARSGSRLGTLTPAR